MTARPCPICGKPALPEFRPFCSARCANVDLNRWLSGLYSIEGESAEEDESSPLDPESDR
ncbi:MAG TPA: DNA gyrase inhibitor YacG [Caulobacteraceae bacterium]